MTETLLFFVAVLTASIVVMWCERSRLEQQIACLQNDVASERSTGSRQMIELAEAKADAIREIDNLSDCHKQATKERDQIKRDLDYAQECYWGEAETAYHLRCSRAAIIDHCRKLKRELANEKRASEHLSSECYTLTKQHDAAIADRDHARKLMDETRERCGAEIDVLEDTIRDLGREKSIAENRGEQLHGENNRLRKDKVRLLNYSKTLRQSRQKIIDHCRLLKRKQTKLMAFSDYILDELTTINTSR